MNTIARIATALLSALVTSALAQAPSITNQPQSITIAQGSSGIFFLGVTGAAPLTYQWKKDGVNLPGATTSSYTITNAQGPAIGDYTVVVTNSAGSATSSVASLSITGIPSDIWRGLIAYYPFSGDAQDATPHNNNGTPTNIVYGLDRNGQPGAAADFSSGDTYVDIPTLNAMPYTPVTYSAWFTLKNYPSPDVRRDDGYFEMTLVGRDFSGSQQEGVLCLYDAGQPYTGPNSRIIYYTGRTGTGSISPDTNKWLHVVFTIDNANNATFYWNGQLISSQVFTGLQTDIDPFRIGASATVGDYRLGWNGKIDDVRIYNRALSSNEVAELYASEAPATNLPPFIDIQPQSVTAVVGTSAAFSVNAGGASPLNYFWRLNGSPISGATNSIYTITNVPGTADGASYSVIVSNAYGSVTSSNAILTVAFPPTITVPPQSQTVTQGSPVTFSVTASGTAPLTYQWQKDGINISDASASTLTITNVQPPNIGSYTVVVANKYGSATSAAASLEVQGVPSGIWSGLIAYYPFNGNARDAGPFANHGDPTNVVYGLDRNGQPGAAADFSSGDAYVEIPTLNAMPYTPVTYSAWFKLNNYPPQDLRRDSDGYFVMTLVGRELSGSPNEGALCLYDAGRPYTGPDSMLLYYTGTTGTASISPDTNKWLHVVFTIDESNNASFYWNGQLTSSEVFTGQQDDIVPFRIGASAGFQDYRLGWDGKIDDVRIYNRALSSNEVAELYASEAPAPTLPPFIDTQPQSVTAVVGTSATFSFSGGGASPLNYFWQANGSPISGATNSIYTITNVPGSADGSSYSVIVSNVNGSVTSSNAILTVVFPPTITVPPQSQTVTQGSPVTFSVTVSGTTPMTYQWKKDGVDIAGASASTFTITNVQPPNIGSYSVVVTNAYGSATSDNASLAIQGVPSDLWTGLIAYYPFTGDAHDASGVGNDGDATNVVYGPDRNGHTNAAADFSSGNAYVEIPTLNAMPYTPVTYSAWFKLNNYPPQNLRRDSDGYFEMNLIGRDLSGSPNEGSLCLYNARKPYVGPDSIFIYYTGTTGTASISPQTNKWVHVAFTIDESNNATFYWNGQLASSEVFTGQQSDIVPFRIGASASFEDYRLGWNGMIDDVRIYNRALTSNQVTQVYASEAPLVLTITTDGSGNVIITWPDRPGFVLESARDLAANPTWAPVSTTPVIINGMASVTQSMSNHPLYFRLRKP